MSPVPMIYCSDKVILIDIAKYFGFLHGYKLVTLRNDKYRVILQCSRSITKTVDSETDNIENRDNLTVKNSKTQNISSPSSINNRRREKKHCKFRIDIQFKRKKQLWLLKPLCTSHDHCDPIKEPFNLVFQSNTKPGNAVSFMDSNSSDLEDKDRNSFIKEAKLCENEKHLDCIFTTHFRGLCETFNLTKDSFEVFDEDGIICINLREL
ncbi:unnamed protein product [[Candida] boidinii]|nr:unnamed protein product [[Candida] boidinii]